MRIMQNSEKGHKDFWPPCPKGRVVIERNENPFPEKLSLFSVSHFSFHFQNTTVHTTTTTTYLILSPVSCLLYCPCFLLSFSPLPYYSTTKQCRLPLQPQSTHHLARYPELVFKIRLHALKILNRK